MNDQQYLVLYAVGIKDISVGDWLLNPFSNSYGVVSSEDKEKLLKEIEKAFRVTHVEEHNDGKLILVAASYLVADIPSLRFPNSEICKDSNFTFGFYLLTPLEIKT